MVELFHNIDGKRVPFTAEEVAEWEAKAAAWEAGATDRKAAEVREERDALLAETDWWASSDLTMTAEQTAYRQALRDVPSQEGFPESVSWPTKP